MQRPTGVNTEFVHKLWIVHGKYEKGVVHTNGFEVFLELAQTINWWNRFMDFGSTLSSILGTNNLGALMSRKTVLANAF